jgi:hypothetical protein
VSETVVELPRSLRADLKEPMGPVYTDAGDLLAAAGRPLIAVGDMVTYHLRRAEATPDVALVDERTERTAVDPDVLEAFDGFDREVAVPNPPATLTADLLAALRTAVDRAPDEATLLVVDGEEDLATLPAILVAPAGASVVYGQPGEGMVLVTVDEDTTARAGELLAAMAGDVDRLRSILDADS